MKSSRTRIARILRSLGYFVSFASVEDTINSGTGKWYRAFESVDSNWPQARGLGSVSVSFDHMLPQRLPELGVLEVDQGVVYTAHGWVLNRRGRIVSDLSWFGTEVDSVKVKKPAVTPLYLKGVSLTLCSHWGHMNYGHFLLDVMCRYKLFLEAGFTIQDVDQVICPLPPNTNTRKLLGRLGIPPSKLHFIDPIGYVVSDRMLAPSFPGTKRCYPKWCVDFLRSLVDFQVPLETHRLFITRSGASNRKISNYNEVEKLLKMKGFDVYEPANRAFPPDDFYRASVVVGPHGAGLADLVFCRPDTHVVEIVPTDHVYPYYFTLAVSGNLNYNYFGAISEAHRPPNSWGPSPHDFVVDLTELRAALSQIV